MRRRETIDRNVRRRETIDRNGRGIETIAGVAGQVVHIRLQHASSGEAVVELFALESIGELTLPRTQIPQLIAALQRAAGRTR